MLTATHMIQRILLIVLISCSTLTFAQEQALDTALQSNESLHPLYIPYIGSAYRVDPNYRYLLTEMAERLQSDTTIAIHVRGHVCCGPAYRLSKRRAKKVYQFLLRAGAPKERLSYKGYSDNCPKRWPEKTEEDTALNRRVDFVVRKLN